MDVCEGPAVDACQRRVAQREHFGVDDGEHGLAAAVAVSQRVPQQVQQTLGEVDGRQQAEG